MAQESAASVRDAQQGRQLRNHDMDGDAGEKSCGHRHRQKIGDPAQAEEAARHQDRAHHQRQHRRQPGIERRPCHRQQRQPAGEDRCDGGIRAHRKHPARSEERKAQRPGDEGEEADFGGKARQPGGGDLFGDGDRGQGEARHQIAGQIGHAPTLKRAKQAWVAGHLHATVKNPFLEIRRKI